MVPELIIERRKRRKRKLEVTENKVVFRKRHEHSFELPPEIAEWLKKNLDIVDWLVFDSAIAPYLRHPHSVRTLIILLYARAYNISISQIVKKLDMAHEQLYRLERLLTKLGLRDQIYEALRSRVQQ